MLTTLPAVILGIVALLKIGNSKGQLRGAAMAIVGTTVPVIILPLEIGILMPAMAGVRQLAFRMTCGENLATLGRAMHAYANDHNGQFPTPATWCDLLSEHAEVAPATFLFRGRHEGPCNYGMNTSVEGLGTSAPPDMVLLYETYPAWNQRDGPELLIVENHQGDGCNVLFVDGHVEFVKPASFEQLRWTVGGPSRKYPPSAGPQRAPPR